MNMSCVGIDIAKKTFVVAVEVSDKVKIKSFNNSILGFNEFIVMRQI
jgi:transposase